MTDTTTPPVETALVIPETRGLQEFAGVDSATYNALKQTIAKDATHGELKAHLLICSQLGISPVGGMAHFVKRDVYNSTTRKREPTFTTQIGIDGFRTLAEATGLYEGPCGLPLFQYEAGGAWTEDIYADRLPYAAKVGVYRRGRREPVWAVAVYRHYVQLRKGYFTETEHGLREVEWERRNAEGVKQLWVPNSMWAKMPHPQLAKCAEALSLRKAFPRQLGGVHTAEEMAQASPVKPPEEEPQPAEGKTVRYQAPDRADEASAVGRHAPASRRGAETISPETTKPQRGSQRSSRASQQEAVAGAATAPDIRAESKPQEDVIDGAAVDVQAEAPQAGDDKVPPADGPAGAAAEEEEPDDRPTLHQDDLDRFQKILEGGEG